MPLWLALITAGGLLVASIAVAFLLDRHNNP